MANNDVALFDPMKNMPAHVAGFFEEESNIADRQRVPSLTYDGKIWTISINGEKTKLIKTNADGDEEPLSTMRVVILDYAQRRGRNYYAGTYDKDNSSAPICWSDDGVAPDASVVEKQHPTCNGCPKSIKGSRISDNGKEVTACAQHRMLVVVPAHNLDFEPLRLKIAITSDFDKQSPDQQALGWFAFSNYTDWLKSRGVQHTAAIVTKIKFDTSEAYPKLFFATERWLENDDLAKSKVLIHDPRVTSLLGGTWTPAGVDGVKKVGNDAAGAASNTTAAQNTAPEVAELPAEKPKQEAASATMVIDEPDEKPEPEKAAAKAETVTEPVATSNDPQLDQILADWGDD